jgi:hypothetical protein
LPSCRLRPSPTVVAHGARNVRPPSGLCSACESVAKHGGLAHAPPAPFLSFSSFGFFFTCREDDFAPSPSTALAPPRLHFRDPARAPSSRRVDDPRPDGLI